MEYGSALYISSNLKNTPYVNDNGYAHMTVNTLTVKEGSRVVFDINGSGNASGDQLNIGTLNVRKQNWQYGPQYLAPIFQFNGTLGSGKYRLGTIGSVASGNLSDIIIEANVSGSYSKSLVIENGVLYLKVSGGSSYEQVYNLDFETASSNNYGFAVAAGNVETMAQVSGNGGHVFHIYQGSNNNRTVNLSFADNSYFTSALSYTFEFDMAVIGGNSNTSTISVIGEAGTLCNISVGAWATSATVTNGSGTSLGTIPCQSYSRSTISSSVVPSTWNHFKLVGSSRGVHLTVTNASGTVLINNAQVFSYTTPVMSISSTLGRYYTHVAFDNITLVSLVSYAKDRIALEDVDTDATGVNDVKTKDVDPDETPTTDYYDLTGRKVSVPEKGKMYIVKMSNGSTKKMIF
jgi:hypothetical protein